MPYQLNFQSVTVDGDTEIVLSGTKDVRVMVATNSPRIIGISNGSDASLIAIQNFSGVSVPLVHNSGSVSEPNRKLLLNGAGSSASGEWALPHGQTVRALSIDPNIDPAFFPNAGRGWAVDNRGQELRARGSATPSSSGPSTSSGTFAVLAEMAVTATFLGGPVDAVFGGSFLVAGGAAGEVQVFVDGVAHGQPTLVSYTSSQGALDPSPSIVAEVSAFARVTGLSAGAHTVDARWRATAGTVQAVGLCRSLSVVEHPP